MSLLNKLNNPIGLISVSMLMIDCYLGIKDLPEVEDGLYAVDVRKGGPLDADLAEHFIDNQRMMSEDGPVDKRTLSELGTLLDIKTENIGSIVKELISECESFNKYYLAEILPVVKKCKEDGSYLLVSEKTYQKYIKAYRLTEQLIDIEEKLSGESQS